MLETLGRIVITRGVFALALAMVMVWAGHGHASLQLTDSPTWHHNGLQGHDHQATHDYPACSDQPPPSRVADHLHETPLLTRLKLPSVRPEHPRLTSAPDYAVLSGTTFLIERPPRPVDVL